MMPKAYEQALVKAGEQLDPTPSPYWRRPADWAAPYVELSDVQRTEMDRVVQGWPTVCSPEVAVVLAYWYMQTRKAARVPYAVVKLVDEDIPAFIVAEARLRFLLPAVHWAKYVPRGPDLLVIHPQSVQFLPRSRAHNFEPVVVAGGPR